jgi:hypothetical protein
MRKILLALIISKRIFYIVVEGKKEITLVATFGLSTIRRNFIL